MCNCAQGATIQPFDGVRGECAYDLLTLTDWLTKLMTIKAEDKVSLIHLTYPQINSYIGVVQSAVNFNENPCYFEQQLNEISNVITVINAL